MTPLGNPPGSAGDLAGTTADGQASGQAHSQAGIVVVGSSLTGLRTVEALRSSGYDGKLTLIGEEIHLPYDRPALSKKILTGELTPEDIAYVDADGIRALNVDLVLGAKATALDIEVGRVMLDTGAAVAYDDVVIATGARARQPFVGLPGHVFSLRTIDDAVVLRKALTAGSRLVIVGGGFIGLEVASSARSLGVEVAVIEAELTPLSRNVGAEAATLIGSLAVDAGVELLCGRGVTSFNGTPNVESVTLDDGTLVHGDVVLIGIGAVPNVEWLEGSGLDVGRGGVLCDSSGRAMGSETVWAAGDVAAWSDVEGTHHRHEHWTSAGEQARIVARNIVTRGTSTTATASFVWSDQFGKRISIVGDTSSYDDVHFLSPNPGVHDLAALYSRNGNLVGACIIDQPSLVLKCRRWVGEARSLHDAMGVLVPS